MYRGVEPTHTQHLAARGHCKVKCSLCSVQHPPVGAVHICRVCGRLKAQGNLELLDGRTTKQRAPHCSGWRPHVPAVPQGRGMQGACAMQLGALHCRQLPFERS